MSLTTAKQELRKQIRDRRDKRDELIREIALLERSLASLEELGGSSGGNGNAVTRPRGVNPATLDRVVAFLREHQPVKAKLVTDRLQLTSSTVSSALRQLEAAGRVRKFDRPGGTKKYRGRWSVAEYDGAAARRETVVTPGEGTRPGRITTSDAQHQIVNAVRDLGPLAQSEIVETTGLTKQKVSETIAELERNQIVARVATPQDARFAHKIVYRDRPVNDPHNSGRVSP